MATFEVESYKVSTELARHSSDGRFITRRTRTIELTGPRLHHGIRNKATIAFSDAFNSFSSDVVGSVGNSTGLSVVGWYPTSEFQTFYDIVRSEGPLHIEYHLKDRSATTGYLRRIELNSGTEPIGEGPADAVTRLMAMVENESNGQIDLASLLSQADQAELETAG